MVQIDHYVIEHLFHQIGQNWIMVDGDDEKYVAIASDEFRRLSNSFDELANRVIRLTAVVELAIEAYRLGSQNKDIDRLIVEASRIRRTNYRDNE